MTTTYKDHKLYFETAGIGNPILLLHGFLESGEIWDDFIKEFSPRRQVIWLDLPGHGKSEVIAEEHSMELFAGAASHVLQELGINKTDVMGHSMGGYVALALLENNLEHVNRIILLNSTSLPDSEERKENRIRSTELVQRNKKAFVSMAISNLLSRENNKKFKVEIDFQKERALQFPTEGIIAALVGMKNRQDRTAVLKAFSGKKFILAGEEDPLIDFDEIKALVNETGAELYSFQNGHLSYLENKKELFHTLHFLIK